MDKILRETTPTTLGGGEQTRVVRDHEIHAAESLTTAIGVFDEADAGVVEAQTRLPRCVRLHWQFYDLSPTGGEVCGIGGLDLCCGDAAHDVGADSGLPIPACGMPGAIERFAADLLIDFEKAAAGVARVELHDAVFWLIVLQRLADAEFRHAAFAGRVVIALEVEAIMGLPKIL